MIRIFVAAIALGLGCAGIASAQGTPRPEQAILDQFLANGCWPDQSDLPGAERLSAVIRVRFGRDGHFLEPPRLIEPQEMPRDGSSLQTFIQRAFRGLEKCNAMGFRVPEEYFSKFNSPVVDLHFTARAGNGRVG